MNRLLRTFVVLPLLALLLVALPALIISLLAGPSAQAKTVPPGQGTVPVTETPTRAPYWPPPHKPHHPPYHRPPYGPGTVPNVWPTPTATPLPTPTPAPEPESFTVGGYPLRQVIGNRLSPVIYAYTTDSRLYRSTNNGRSWSLVTTRPAVPDFIMSPADPYVLYSGRALVCDAISEYVQPVFVSTDGGGSFMTWEPPVSLTPVLAHPSDARRALAAACDGIYETRDGGRSWEMRSGSTETALWRDYVGVEMAAAVFGGQAAPAEPGWEHLYVAAAGAGGTGVVAYSNDEGDTWGQISPSSAVSPFRITSLAADPAVAGRVWVAEAAGVWRTLDNGLFWGLSNQGLEAVLGRGSASGSVGLHDLVVHPNGNLYLGTAAGLYEKPLEEIQWIKTDAGDAPFGFAAVTSILFTDSRPGLLWLNTDAGVFQHEVAAE